MTHFSIAIDGPAGAGKSTIAKEVAKKLNLVYIDTGAMYRAITLKALDTEQGINEEVVQSFLEKTTITFDNDLVLLDNKDVSEDIRTINVTSNVSKVASYKSVRDFLVNQQQQIAKSNDVIMDGRDIGTRVIPDASLKIFLVASIEERARRRYYDNLNRNIEVDLETIKKDLESRDLQDSTRQHSPLKRASDAIELDTSNMTIEEVVNEIIELAKKRKVEA